MKNVVLLPLLALLVLTGCSKPKDTVIPADPNKWATIQESAQKLSPEDKRLLAAYMLRSSMAAAFTHNAIVIPEGTTIGDAIDKQREFESQQSTDEAKAEALKASVQKATAAAVAKMNHAITFAALGISVLPQNIEAGRYSTELSVPFVVKNNTAKDITGVKGEIELKDVFGETLKRLEVSADRSVPAGQQVTMADYVWKLNEFENEDQHLMSMDLSKVKAAFIPSMIVFSDGSKESSPQQ